MAGAEKEAAARAEVLVEWLLEGDKRAIARLISHVEDNTAVAAEALKLLWPHTGKGWFVGITGPPGAGKSTLVEGLSNILAAKGYKVAVLAVDPSSPFTGGALLGDRLRMVRAADAGIFIRSMSTRGHLGGLALATANAARVLDAAGCDFILIETVGAGQAEVEVVEVAHAVAVVTVPGLGDEVQALKAGILEIADFFIINKADRPGVERLEKELTQIMELAVSSKHGGLLRERTTKLADYPRRRVWQPPILPTVAIENKGLEEVAEALFEHKLALMSGGTLVQRERDRLSRELLKLARRRLLEGLLARLDKGSLEELAGSVQRREIDPLSAVEQLVQEA